MTFFLCSRFRIAALLAAAAAIAAAQQPPAAQEPPAAPPSASGPTGLTDAQKQMLKGAEADLAAKMAPLAQKLSKTATDLDRALLAQKPDPEAERKLGEQFASAVADLVTSAIRARVASLHDIVATLTPEQKRLLLAELDKPGANPDLLELMKKVFGAPQK
jgi:Spy/CpxP family protein refolding chaperone